MSTHVYLVAIVAVTVQSPNVCSYLQWIIVGIVKKGFRLFRGLPINDAQ